MDGTGTVECIPVILDRKPTDLKFYEGGYSVVPFGNDRYACYAFSFTGGATLKWFRDNFAEEEHRIAVAKGGNVYADLDRRVSDKPTGILVLPHFAGAATPYMDNGARAVMAGLTLSHTGADIYRALMEGVTYEMRVNMEHLAAFGIAPRVLYAVGGGAASPLWLSIKADVLERPITPLTAPEVGACGTAMLCAVSLGLYPDLPAAKAAFVQTGETYLPDPENRAIYQKNFAAYQKLYAACRPILAEVTDE